MAYRGMPRAPAAVVEHADSGPGTSESAMIWLGPGGPTPRSLRHQGRGLVRDDAGATVRRIAGGVPPPRQGVDATRRPSRSCCAG